MSTKILSIILLMMVVTAGQITRSRTRNWSGDTLLLQRVVPVDPVDSARAAYIADTVRHLPSMDSARAAYIADTVRHLPSMDSVRAAYIADTVRHLPSMDSVRAAYIADTVRHLPTTLYFGNDTVNGTWRATEYNDTFRIQVRVSGHYIDEFTLTPTWLQYCDFETDLCTGWHNKFVTNWYQRTENGEGIAYRLSNGVEHLYPDTGIYLTGDFTIEFGYWVSTSQGTGNNSIHVQMVDSVGTTRLDSRLFNLVIRGLSGTFTAPTGPAVQKMKIVRQSGVIWCYRWYSAAWQREDSWTNPGTSLSFSGKFYITVDGADGVNGISYIGIAGTLQ